MADMAMEDRPREKCARTGINSLSNTELLAIIIGNGTRNQSAIDLARKILLQARNDLYYLGKLSAKELQDIKGIGWAKTVRILAALELGKRRMEKPIPIKKSIRCSRDAFEILKPELSELAHEEFWIILLSRSNKVLDKIKISQGGVSGTITDIRIILQEAISRLASGIILAHNHPSGNLSPSEADKKISFKIKDAASLMDISVLDHLIIGEDEYFSFADQNLL
ncbi:MAG: DNA repair protein RadC [Bacteroidales bacterium]|nr:DNA repair protein RadC [Bacteroidales bacterium]